MNLFFLTVRSEPEKSSDPRVWDPVCLKNVASKVAECYKDIYSKLPKRSPSNKEIIVVSLNFNVKTNRKRMQLS